MTSYAEFLARKAAAVPEAGRTIDSLSPFPQLRSWQAEIVDWAAKVGRAAIWADTGLGKTFMQLAWAAVMTQWDEQALIVAPLAICEQTATVEAPKLGLKVAYVRTPEEMLGSDADVFITNYERLAAFDPAAFKAVVLDEASILKSSDGKMRRSLIEWAQTVPYRLACTATPAPNDPEELTNQAEFLGHMTRTNMLAAYFVHDQDGWRLKGHARGPMMRWMATWALAIRRPSDLGDYSDEGYDLPGVQVVPELVDVTITTDGSELVPTLGGVSGRAEMRRATLDARCRRAAELVAAEPDEPWLIWCGLNDEADLVARLTGGLNIHGSMAPEAKADGLLGFARGDHRVIITKPSIAAQGLNYQHCARMIFVGLSDSYEQYYQAIRRCHRYGQTRVVRAHVVLSAHESQIATNVARKESSAARITDELVSAMRAARKDTAA